MKGKSPREPSQPTRGQPAQHEPGRSPPPLHAPPRDFFSEPGHSLGQDLLRFPEDAVCAACFHLLLPELYRLPHSLKLFVSITAKRASKLGVSFMDSKMSSMLAVCEEAASGESSGWLVEGVSIRVWLAHNDLLETLIDINLYTDLLLRAPSAEVGLLLVTFKFFQNEAGRGN